MYAEQTIRSILILRRTKKRYPTTKPSSRCRALGLLASGIRREIHRSIRIWLWGTRRIVCAYEYEWRVTETELNVHQLSWVAIECSIEN